MPSSNYAEEPAYVVLLVLDKDGEERISYVYPCECLRLAEFVFECTKKRIEGYH